MDGSLRGQWSKWPAGKTEELLQSGYVMGTEVGGGEMNCLEMAGDRSRKQVTLSWSFGVPKTVCTC